MKNIAVGMALVLFVVPILGTAGCDDDENVAGPSVTVGVTPEAVTLDAGETQHFSAVVTGSSNTDVIWSVDGGPFPPYGTISEDGLYTAPGGNGIEVSGVFTVRATSAADTFKSGTATVTIEFDPGGGGDW